MSNPPEWTPERTHTQRIADDITRAARNLRRDWPHMLRDGDTQPPGAASTSGVQLDDHDPRGTDQRRLTRTLSLRRYVQDVLNSWSRVVIEDRGVKKPAVRCRHGIDVWVTMRFPWVGPLPKPVPRCRRGRPLIGNTHVVRGSDVDDLLDFMETNAEWMGGHEAAQDCRDEIVELAKQCHLVAFPPRRESMRLGSCPLEIPGEQDVLERCTGSVRYRLAHDERDGEAMAACDHCGEAAVISWWEDRMFDDPELQKRLDADGVCRLVHRTWGEVITRATVRQWVRRGIIEPTATEEGKPSTYDRDAVVYAVDLWKRRAGLST